MVVTDCVVGKFFGCRLVVLADRRKRGMSEIDWP